jgi:CDP-diacylglycerol--glycerol-3-phosphate 3-phosphatidyltransferase
MKISTIQYQKEKSIIFNIPNTLTLCRIIVIPIFIIILLYSSSKLFSFIAAFLFTAASLTDLLDGYIARKWNLETSLGKFLDPLADKLLVAVALIMLIPLGRVPPWMVAVIIGREILVTGLRTVAVTEGLIIAASKWGKYKAAMQTMSVICLLLHFDYQFFGDSQYFLINLHQVGIGLLWIALLVTIWSGIDYFNKFFKQVFHL